MTLRVVLVRTHNPGNLGAAARAAKNFGAELLLLQPRAPIDHPDAVAFASGAEDFLRKVNVVPAWGELLASTDTLMAITSLRGRVSRGLPPPTTFEEISRSLRSSRALRARLCVALVFGPERGGLTTEELRLCDARLTIPTRGRSSDAERGAGGRRRARSALSVQSTAAKPRNAETRRTARAFTRRPPSPDLFQRDPLFGRLPWPRLLEGSAGRDRVVPAPRKTNLP